MATDKPYQGEGIEEGLDFPSLCEGELHPSAIEGLKLFNAGHYWEAHEALETAWIEEESPARHLYKGILQAGVMYLQIERSNFIGMAKMYERARRWLAPWPDMCRGVNVGKLKADVEAAISAAGKLGPERLEEFDRGLLKTVEYEI